MEAHSRNQLLGYRTVKEIKVRVRILFGPFLYKVSKFDDSEGLDLSARNATGVFAIHFDRHPVKRLIQLTSLFSF